MHVKAKDNSPSALQNQKSYRIYGMENSIFYVFFENLFRVF